MRKTANKVVFICITFFQQQPMYMNVSMYCSVCTKDVRKGNLYRNLKTEMRWMIMTGVIKIHDVLFLKKWWASFDRNVTAAWLVQHMFAIVRPGWHSQHIVARRYRHRSFLPNHNNDIWYIRVRMQLKYCNVAYILAQMFLQCVLYLRWIILWRFHFSNMRVLLSVLDFHCEATQLWMFLLCCNRVLTKP